MELDKFRCLTNIEQDSVWVQADVNKDNAYLTPGKDFLRSDV
jgi:hypothetical protein